MLRRRDAMEGRALTATRSTGLLMKELVASRVIDTVTVMPIMKSSFKSFMLPSSDETKGAWRSDDTIFVFDTNVLLNLYGFEQQTREDFFSIASKLGKRIWIPFHVGLEYNKQRLAVIGREKKVFRTINSITEKLTNQLTSDLNNLKLKDKLPEVHDSVFVLIEKIKAAIADFNTELEPWDHKQPDVRSEDLILNRIDEITTGKIGPAPVNQAWLDAVYVEGSYRYENKIPPGYKDAAKDSGTKIDPDFIHNQLSYKRQFGDLIIWKQILEHAEVASIKNIFFVTDDLKEDWWSTIHSGGNKPIGPREELRKEAYNIGRVELFHMYTTSDFLSSGQAILDVSVQESSISDALPHAETSAPDDHPDLNNIRDVRPWLDRNYIDPKLFEDSIRHLKIPTINPKDYEHLLAVPKYNISTLPPEIKNILSAFHPEPNDAWNSINLHYDPNKSHAVLDYLKESQESVASTIQKIINHNEALDRIRQMGLDTRPSRLKKDDDDDDDDDDGEPA